MFSINFAAMARNFNSNLFIEYLFLRCVCFFTLFLLLLGIDLNKKKRTIFFACSTQKTAGYGWISLASSMFRNRLSSIHHQRKTRSMVELLRRHTGAGTHARKCTAYVMRCVYIYLLHGCVLARWANAAPMTPRSTPIQAHIHERFAGYCFSPYVRVCSPM